jgi:hypothetical protein
MPVPPRLARLKCVSDLADRERRLANAVGILCFKKGRSGVAEREYCRPAGKNQAQVVTGRPACHAQTARLGELSSMRASTTSIGLAGGNRVVQTVAKVFAKLFATFFRRGKHLSQI